MRTEIEAMFLAVELEETKQRLEKLTAVLAHPMRRVRCAIVDDPNQSLRKDRGASVKVRDEGDRVMLIYEEVIEQRRGGTKQIDLGVDSFEDAIKLLEKLGLGVISLQESRQEVWRLGSVHLIIEEWPWLKPFIEVIGSSEAAIRDASARLGFAWSQAAFGSATLAYAAEYPGIDLARGESISRIPQIKFGAPLPNWLKERQVT